MTRETHLLERYQKLIEISRELASTLDLNALLEQIVHAAADLCDAEAASILLYDATKQELYFQAASNLTEPDRRGLVVSMDSLAGWIFTHQQPVLISDVSKDPRHGGEVAAQFATRTLLGVPISTKNKPVGVLEALNKRSGQFTEQDQDLLMALGAQAAVAIENTRLFQQSDLIAEFVHELRTPLTALSTAIPILQRSEISEEQRKSVISTLSAETKRLSEMASAFLDLARLESGRAQFRFQSFKVPNLLHECANLMKDSAAEKNLSLHLIIPEDLPSLKADQDKIKQVVLNLLNNAVKYTPSGGTITLEAKLSDQKTMAISVTDTGVGIPPEGLTHLFEKFFRAPSSLKMAHGTGLGLSICKKIVEGHGGHINVQSEVDKGTTFEVYLPILEITAVQ